MTQMSLSAAIQILVDCASRWAENAEEAFPRRITAFESDTELRKLVGEDELSEAIEVRDLWQAIEIAIAHLNKPIEGAPR